MLARFLAIALAGLFIAPAAVAQPSPAASPLVARAIAYLERLDAVKGTFEQTDPRGGVSSGALWLARPGRARFQYDPPSDIVITCDGRTVTVSNPRLNTLQRAPQSATPLAVLLSDHIRLDRGVRVVRVDQTPGGFSITARDARGLAQGDLTLYFGDGPIRLAGWVIRDGAGRVTRVSLGPLTPAPALPPGFFSLARAG